MNVPFAVAAGLALVAAAIHGGVGEAQVVMKLRTDSLAPTQFGGPRMTKLMIRATWHITTLAFVVTGVGLATCSASSAAACGGVGRMSAAAFSAFAVLTLALGAREGAVRTLRRHPAPLVFVLVAVLTWWGSASY